MKNGPIAQSRVGRVKASIWKNGDKFYTFTLQQLFKDKADKWQSSSSFTISDIDSMISVLLDTRKQILELSKEKKEAA